MDETAIAFEMPHVRAAATQGSQPLDRISVRDYTRTVEIGAFRSERGVTQRIRFNVVLEVSHHTAAQDDDVDKVISYDTITDAIETELAAERVNLLETLAERVAVRSLADPRAVRVFVRIEKLDRIPGALGVEIMRARLPGTAQRLRRIEDPAVQSPGPRPRIVYLAPTALATAEAWIAAVRQWNHPAVLVVPPLIPQPASTCEATLRIGLLAIEQAAWALSGSNASIGVVASRAELDRALKSGHLTVWAPVKMLTDAVRPPDVDASHPAELAVWLASELGAEILVLAGETGPAPRDGIAIRSAALPHDLGP